MRIRLVVLLSLVAAACTSGTTATTTTEAATTTAAPVTTTTIPGGRIELAPNGPVFVEEGTRGPFVEALQFNLVCSGISTIGPEGPEVGVDGSFGPITADAVAIYQAVTRRIPTGEPDEETFAALARDCADERPVGFEDGASTTEVAGNSTEGDPDVFVVTGAAKQLLTIVGLEGGVTWTVTGADGTSVESPGAEPWEAELPSAQTYRITVEASAPTSYRMSVGLRSALLVATDFGPMVLEPDGLAVSSFGDTIENTMAVVELLLGRPLIDSDWQSDVATCTGTTRHVTWIVQAAAGTDQHPAILVIDFTQQGESGAFAQYTYRSFDLDAMDPVVQSLTTESGISLGDTLADYATAHGQPEFYDADRGLTRFGGGMVAGFEPGEDQDTRRIYYVGSGDDGCQDFT